MPEGCESEDLKIFDNSLSKRMMSKLGEGEDDSTDSLPLPDFQLFIQPFFKLLNIPNTASWSNFLLSSVQIDSKFDDINNILSNISTFNDLYHVLSSILSPFMKASHMDENLVGFLGDLEKKSYIIGSAIKMYYADDHELNEPKITVKSAERKIMIF